MERYFCVDCESVIMPGRVLMFKSEGMTICPLCRSRSLRLWEAGKAIPDYYGRVPEFDQYAGSGNCCCQAGKEEQT
jgi:hypothetical protein